MSKKWDFTDEMRSELQAASRSHPKPHIRVKAMALLHMANGRTALQAAEAVFAHRVSVSDWARRYLENGLVGLEVADGRGRPTEVNAEEIASYIRRSPREFGIDATRWSLSALAEVVPCLKGMSPAGVKKALERCGFAYKRGQPHLHSPDPDYEEKKGQWTKL